ncbi:MAG: autorepressor SdpR family transcription factor [Sphaerochaeta sp.]|nr:autorepressor SdpR family transcription factor [Sphaerochaeta sp.]
MKAISDPARRQILAMLKDGRLTAGEIASRLENLSSATVSYHLSQLKKATLVSESKYKNFIYYELNASVFEEIMMWCAQFTQGSELHEPKN